MLKFLIERIEISKRFLFQVGYKNVFQQIFAITFTTKWEAVCYRMVSQIYIAILILIHLNFNNF